MTCSAVVLLSGGLDSMVCAALAREQGFAVLALTVNYGQRHRIELEAAIRIAAALADRHVVLELDLRQFGGSALTGDIDDGLIRVDCAFCSHSFPITLAEVSPDSSS